MRSCHNRLASLMPAQGSFTPAQAIMRRLFHLIHRLIGHSKPY